MSTKAPKTRPATEADRKAALDALAAADIPAKDMEDAFNAYSNKWNLKQCGKALEKAGVDGDEIYRIFQANDPRTQAADQPDADTAISADATAGDEQQPEPGAESAPCDPAALPASVDNAAQPAPQTDAPAATDDTAETARPDDGELLVNPRNVRKLGRETIEVEQELTDAEKLEVGGRMAKALADRDRLELEFAGVKKDYKARIDLAVSEAAEAGAEFRAGMRKLTVRAVKFEDRSTMEIVYVEPDGAQRELMRRPMTHEERMNKLPMATSESDDAPQTQAAPPIIGETEPTPDQSRTCITCMHMVKGDAEMPEACQTCSQCDSGPDDNWQPKRECASCAHSTTRVDMYPCSGCALNPDGPYAGPDDRWEFRWDAAAVCYADDKTAPDAGEQDAAPNDDAMPTAETDSDGMPALDPESMPLAPVDTMHDAPEVQQ